MSGSKTFKKKVHDLWLDYLSPLSAHSPFGQSQIYDNRAIEWEGGVVPTEESARQQATAAAAARAAAAGRAAAATAPRAGTSQSGRGECKTCTPRLRCSVSLLIFCTYVVLAPILDAVRIVLSSRCLLCFC